MTLTESTGLTSERKTQPDLIWASEVQSRSWTAWLNCGRSCFLLPLAIAVCT